MITAENLGKSYGPKTAVAGINFTVQPGKVTGFLGPSGATDPPPITCAPSPPPTASAGASGHRGPGRYRREPAVLRR